MRYFVTADIHGYFDEFITALNNKGFNPQNPNHKLVICGDLFDRGRQPAQIIDFVLEHKDSIILIRGNHEDLMQEMINRNEATITDIQNRTAQTVSDLCPEWDVTEFSIEKIAKETRLQEVLDSCINYYETNHFVFVHGWLPIIGYNFEYDENWRHADEESWKKSRWANPVTMFRCKVFEPNKTIICGHWHCSAFWHAKDPARYDEFGENACFEPFITRRMIALDACTALTRKVNVIVFDD